MRVIELSTMLLFMIGQLSATNKISFLNLAEGNRWEYTSGEGSFKNKRIMKVVSKTISNDTTTFIVENTSLSGFTPGIGYTTNVWTSRYSVVGGHLLTKSLYFAYDSVPVDSVDSVIIDTTKYYYIGYHYHSSTQTHGELPYSTYDSSRIYVAGIGLISNGVSSCDVSGHVQCSSKGDFLSSFNGKSLPNFNVPSLAISQKSTYHPRNSLHVAMLPIDLQGRVVHSSFDRKRHPYIWIISTQQGSCIRLFDSGLSRNSYEFNQK